MRKDEKLMKGLDYIDTTDKMAGWKGVFAFTKEGRQNQIMTFELTRKRFAFTCIAPALTAIAGIINPTGIQAQNPYILTTLIAAALWFSLLLSYGTHTWIPKKYLKG